MFFRVLEWPKIVLHMIWVTQDCYSKFLSDQRLFSWVFEYARIVLPSFQVTKVWPFSYFSERPKIVLHSFWVTKDCSADDSSDLRLLFKVFEWPQIVIQSFWVTNDSSLGFLSSQGLFFHHLNVDLQRFRVTKHRSSIFLSQQRLLFRVFKWTKIVLQMIQVTKDCYLKFLSDKK